MALDQIWSLKTITATKLSCLVSGCVTDSSRHVPTFVTHHALTLLAIARDPGTRMRHLAGRLGITKGQSNEL
jgi:hypothetical protein